MKEEHNNSGVHYLGLSDSGDYRKPTILQIVFWRNTGKLVNLASESKAAGRLDVTGPIGNMDGRRVCIQMLDQARQDIEQTNYVFSKESRLLEKLRIKNIASEFPLVEAEHDILQLFLFPDLGEIEVVSSKKDDKWLMVNMIERARQFLMNEVLWGVPAVPYGVMSKIANGRQ